jgi:hypothetical protein
VAVNIVAPGNWFGVDVAAPVALVPDSLTSSGTLVCQAHLQTSSLRSRRVALSRILLDDSRVLVMAIRLDTETSLLRASRLGKTLLLLLLHHSLMEEATSTSIR